MVSPSRTATFSYLYFLASANVHSNYVFSALKSLSSPISNSRLSKTAVLEYSDIDWRIRNLYKQFFVCSPVATLDFEKSNLLPEYLHQSWVNDSFDFLFQLEALNCQKLCFPFEVFSSTLIDFCQCRVQRSLQILHFSTTDNFDSLILE